MWLQWADAASRRGAAALPPPVRSFLHTAAPSSFQATALAALARTLAPLGQATAPAAPTAGTGAAPVSEARQAADEGGGAPSVAGAGKEKGAEATRRRLDEVIRHARRAEAEQGAAAQGEGLRRSREVAAQEEALRAMRQRTRRAGAERRARERERAHSVDRLLRAARDAWEVTRAREAVPADREPPRAIVRPATGVAGRGEDPGRRAGPRGKQAPQQSAQGRGACAKGDTPLSPPPPTPRGPKAPAAAAPLQFRLECAGIVAFPVRDTVGLRAGACWAEVLDEVARAVGRASHVGVLPHGATRPITCRSRRQEVLAPVGRVPSGGQSAVLRVVVMHKVKGGRCLCGRLASSLGAPCTAAQGRPSGP